MSPAPEHEKDRDQSGRIMSSVLLLDAFEADHDGHFVAERLRAVVDAEVGALEGELDIEADLSAAAARGAGAGLFDLDGQGLGGAAEGEFTGLCQLLLAGLGQL